MFIVVMRNDPSNRHPRYDSTHDTCALALLRAKELLQQGASQAEVLVAEVRAIVSAKLTIEVRSV